MRNRAGTSGHAALDLRVTDRRRRRRRSERGFTLIEMLITISIMAASIVVLAAAFENTIRHAGIVQRRAQVESEGRRVGEILRSSAVAYNGCDALPSVVSKYDTDLHTAAGNIVSGLSYTVDQTMYSAANRNGSGRSDYSATCTAGTTPKVTRLRLTVTMAGTNTVETSVYVVKRNPSFSP